MSGQLANRIGKLEPHGTQALLRAALLQEWGGVLRLRSAEHTGALWLVNGHLVHAVLQTGGRRLEGPEALKTILTWCEGTYWAEAGELPPARTIREPLDRILAAGNGADSPADPFQAEPLARVFATLRERVPGLESLSVTHEGTLEATTTDDPRERDWLDGQLRRYFAEDRLEPERLFVQQGDHALLILSRGSLAAVLSARAGTTPEALFWAGEEAKKRVLMTD